MGILSFFKKKTTEINEKHELTETDRAYSVERRKINAELRRTKQDIEIAKAKLQLKELEDELGDYDEEEEEEPQTDTTALLMTALIPLLTGKNQPQIPAQNSSNTQEISKVELSQEQIEQLYKENKKYIKFAKNMTDEQIRTFLLNRMPDLSDKSLSDIIARVRK